MVEAPNRVSVTLITASAILIIAGLSIVSCSRTDEQPHGGSIMAEIGDYRVTEEEFLGAFRNVFERSGHALQVTPSLLQEILDQRVNFYSIVQHGMDRGWDRDREGLYRKNLIYRQVMMDEFKRSLIEPEISVDEGDLRELFYRYNTHVRASHLYAPDRETADSLYHLVTGGVSFEELAKEIFESSTLRNSGGDLGYFTVDEMDVGFEEVAYTTPVGEVAGPVRTSRGFSIIKVKDRITTPLITENQFAESKNRIRELAIRQQTELERRADMDRVIDRFRFNEELASEIRDRIMAHLPVDPVYSLEQEDIRNLVPPAWDGRVIASYDGFDITTGTFLQEVYYTPEEALANAGSPAGFRNLLEGVAYRAYAMHTYQNSRYYDEELIARSVENTFQNYLNRRFVEELRAKANIPEEAKREEFRRNPDLYTHPKEVNMAELAVQDMETAEEAYQAIQNGMPFEEALMKYGFDEEAKLAGGEIGYTPVTHFGTISPAIADIQPGEIAGPFEMRSDVIFLFKCLGVRDAHPMTFEEALPTIIEHLTGEYVAEQRAEIIRETMERHNARVHYNRIDKVNLHL